MKIQYSLMVALLMLGNVAAQSGLAEEVDESRIVDPSGIVKIKSLRGEVRVEGWNKNEVRVRGDLDDLATGLHFDVEGNQTRVEIKMPGQNVNWGDGSDLLIQVPLGSRIVVDSVSSDIYAEKLVAGVQIRTVSGEIELRDARDLISLRSVSGSIHTEDTQGELRATSSSGELNVRNHKGNAQVETMSGEIDLEESEVARLTGASISGEINVQAQLLETVIAEITSVSGEVVVEVISPNNLTILAQSTSGDIDNDLTDDKVTDSFGRRSLDTRIGDGSGALNIRTVSGAIELDEG